MFPIYICIFAVQVKNKAKSSPVCVCVCVQTLPAISHGSRFLQFMAGCPRCEISLETSNA